MQTPPPTTDLPQHFTDATRAILVDWLIQVHVSCLALTCINMCCNMRFFDPVFKCRLRPGNGQCHWFQFLSMSYYCKFQRQLEFLLLKICLTQKAASVVEIWLGSTVCLTLPLVTRCKNIWSLPGCSLGLRSFDFSVSGWLVIPQANISGKIMHLLFWCSDFCVFIFSSREPSPTSKCRYNYKTMSFWAVNACWLILGRMCSCNIVKIVCYTILKFENLYFIVAEDGTKPVLCR